MINAESHSLSEMLKQEKISAPSLHIVLGSGLAPAFSGEESPTGFRLLREIPFKEVKGLVPSSAPGHKGVFKFYEEAKTKKVLCFQVGRLHGYEGHSPQEVVAPLIQSALAGTPKFILNNAAGSLKSSFLPGSLMMINDQVNFTGQNPLHGINPKKSNGEAYGPRFPDMSAAYNKEFNAALKNHLTEEKFAVHEGTYIGVSGPSYETPAEVRLFAQWGMGAVGMSTVWEAIALSYFAKTVAGISFISNLGCGLSNTPLSHQEVEEEAARVAPKLLRSLFNFAAKDFS